MDFEAIWGSAAADYEDIRILNSKGGMGDIFRAHKKGLDVPVAIKRIKTEYKNRMDQEREADILKRLKHQYLPRIYDVIQGSDGFLYTVMDLIPGRDMQEEIKANGAATQKQAMKWGMQLCEVVSYLHHLNPPILHCDIKPHNIMITPEGNICLIDFNTSLIIEEDDTVLGVTPGYAAPEQYQKSAKEETDKTVFVPDGASPRRVNTKQSVTPSFSRAITGRAGGYGEVSPRTDLYSIGATLYYAVSAHRPEKSLDAVTPLSVYRPSVSRPFLQVIARAMQQEQGRRFGDAQEMLRALKNIPRQESDYRRLFGARRLAFALILLGLAASIASMAWGWNALRSERENAYLNLVNHAAVLEESGDAEAGMQEYQQAIAMQPGRSDAYYGLAVLLYHQGSYQQAVDLLEDAFQSATLSESALTENERANLHYIKGNCFLELEQYRQAADELSAAWELVKNTGQSAAYCRSLAIAQARCGNTDEAERLLSALEANGGSNSDCAYVRAEIANMQGDTDTALQGYREAWETTADTRTAERAYLAAASLCKNAGRMQEEAELLEQAVSALSAEQTVALRGMLAEAYCTLAEEQPQAAAEWYGKAEQVLEGLWENGRGTLATQLNLAVVRQYLGNYDGAEELLLAAQEAYPKDYRPEMRLAFLYADWQGSKPVDSRDYTEVQQRYSAAKEKYQLAQANGESDSSMAVLEDLIGQLHTAGWL